MLGLLRLPALQIEMRATAMDRLHENQRDIRMRLLDLLDKREQALTDRLPSRIRESIEHQGIHVRSLQNLCEIRLQLAIAAATQTQHLDTRIARELVGITHTGAADADPLRETRAEDADPVTER